MSDRRAQPSLLARREQERGEARCAPSSSPHMIFCATSSSREGISNGRIPICIEYSANRAERFADRTEAKVARASTRVPAAVASEAIVVQSVMGRDPIAL